MTRVRPWRFLGRLPAAAALLLAAGLAAGFAMGRSMGRQDSSQAVAELDAKLRGEREGFAGALLARRRLDAELAALRRSVPTFQEDLRRAAGDLASLRKERDSLASALDGSRREAEETSRDLRRRLEEAVALAALPRMGPEAAVPPSSGGAPSGREPPLARREAAQRSVSAQSVVALDRRDSRGGSLTIDVRGSDEQVIPDLLVLSESREPELARLARRLLRERSPGLPAEDVPTVAGRTEASGGSGVLLGSLGGLVEKAAEGLGVREPRSETQGTLGSTEEWDVEREVERLKRYWTSRGIGDDSGASTMKL